MSSTNTPDIFISYNHVDNSSKDKAIDQFVKELEAQVNKQVGRSAPQRIWKDNRLDGNQVFSTEIQQKLKHAHCFVLFLSRGYLKSEWCQKELEYFRKQNQQYPERLFVVELDAIPVDDKPEILRKALGYRFWDEDKLSADTYPLEPDNKTYKNKLLKLAKNLAAQIQQAEELKETVRSATQATRNNAYSEAEKLWLRVLGIHPEHPKAAGEIAALQQKQQQHGQAEQLIKLLVGRKPEITPEFDNVATVLRAIDSHPKAQIIIEKTDQFLQNAITADDYIEYCQRELSAKTPQKIGTQMNYSELAKRIRNGDTVLFLGSEIPREYGEAITDE